MSPYRIIGIILAVTLCSHAYGQSSIDSLTKRLKVAAGRERVDVLLELAESYSVVDLDKLESYSDEALRLADSLAYEKGLGNAYYHKTQASIWKSDYEKALEFGIKSESIYKNLGLSLDIGKVYSIIGSVHNLLRNHQLSILYQKRAIELYDSLKDHENVSTAMRILGVSYADMGKLDSAVFYFDQALSQAKLENDEVLQAHALNNLGYVYTNLHQYDEAIRALTDAVQFYAKSKANFRLGASTGNLSRAYLYKGDLVNAEKFALKALALDSALDKIESHVETYMLMSDIYKAKGQYKKAFEYLKFAQITQDTIYSRRESQIAARMDAMESNKRLEIRLLEKEQELAALSYQNNISEFRLIVAIMAVILVVTAAAMVIIFYRARIRKQKFEAWQHEHEIEDDYKIKLANSELTALKAQMNPHFIFNSLNSINRYILKSDVDSASTYLTRFSRLMRIMLENSSVQMVPLQTELDAIELYLQIESIRFENKFTYRIHVDSEIELDSVHIPPMILQPYIENAIWHGLMNKETPGKLTINITETDEDLVCTIQDDGIGREAASRLGSSQNKTKGSMGLKITEGRLQLLTQHQERSSRVEIVDLKDSNDNALGTKIIISIPLAAVRAKVVAV